MKKLHVNWLVLSLFLMSAMFFTACKKDKGDLGTVEGRIFAQNGTRSLPSVKIFVDVKGEIFLTQSDENGRFSLDIPEGDHLLYIHSGDGKIFFSTQNIKVKKGEVLTLNNQQTILNQTANLAFIEGQYDNIQTIIIDSLGYSADQLSMQDLLDLATLENYSAIFLNCGLPGQMQEQMYLNLQAFVNNGGSLYASDYAIEYLTGDGNMSPTAPPHHHDDHEHFDFSKNCNTPLGGFLTANMICTQKQGASGFLNNVNVVHPDIQNAIGGTTMDVNYNLGNWEVIKNLGPEFDVLIEDNGAYGPLAVRSNSLAPWAQGNNNANGNGNNNGNGNSNNQFVTICHIPPGNPNNPQTITISVNALQAHLNHGCQVGPCEGNGGEVLYTTFHNYPQGNVSQDTYDILQYFILNL